MRLPGCGARDSRDPLGGSLSPWSSGGLSLTAIFGMPHCWGGTAGLRRAPCLLQLTLCLSQDGVMVLSATHRYKKKYVTTLLYKPI